MLLLSIDNVAELLSCSRSNVRRLWYAGLLPKPIRMGRRSVRWRVDELQRFIENRPTITFTKEHA